MKTNGRARFGFRTRGVVVAVTMAAAAVNVPGAAKAATSSADQPASQAALDLAGALARFPSFAALPDSLGVSAPTMLHGKLTDLAGGTMPGANILLSAWPSNEAVHAMPVGGTFSLTPVTRTVAGADGTSSSVPWSPRCSRR